VGTVEVFVRLTSQGDLVVTHFNRAPDSNKYQYKAINEYVPTQASAMGCTERIMLKPKKICKHKTSCRKKRANVKQGKIIHIITGILETNELFIIICTDERKVNIHSVLAFRYTI